MREDFVKFCEASLKLFKLIYIKPKEEARDRINHQRLWWQLLFVLNVLSSSGSTKIARHRVQEITREKTIFKHFFESNLTQA